MYSDSSNDLSVNYKYNNDGVRYEEIVMKAKRYVIYIFSIIFILGGIIFGLILFENRYLMSYYRPDSEMIERYFNRDKEEIIRITDYFVGMKSNISFNSVDFKAKNYKSFIKDQKVVDALKTLFEEKGYEVIGINNNTVYFQKWSRGADLGIGLTYLVDLGDKSDLEFLTKLEPLLEKNWYFYEANYNEWRLR